MYKQAWDAVTTKCRGIIVNRETGEIVARPFEKFFNFGDPTNGMTDTAVDILARQVGQPVVWEKVDGFLCIGYNWGGKWYCASKGSFTSPHAKWASAQIQRLDMDSVFHTEGYTPVFEGVCPSLRIVVDYGANEELILTAIIHNDTGIEMPPFVLQSMGDLMGASTPELETLSWQEVQQATYDEAVKNAEGYVLTWYGGAVPYRLKVKYIDYLRVHRMVTGVQNGWTSVLDDATPWFNAFVAKWRRVIEVEAMRLEKTAKDIYDDAQNIVESYDEPAENLGETRKRWAEVFTAPDNKEYSGILFAMLDGKDWRQVIWKKIKGSAIMKNGHPLVDAHNT